MGDALCFLEPGLAKAQAVEHLPEPGGHEIERPCKKSDLGLALELWDPPPLPIGDRLCSLRQGSQRRLSLNAFFLGMFAHVDIYAEPDPFSDRAVGFKNRNPAR